MPKLTHRLRCALVAAALILLVCLPPAQAVGKSPVARLKQAWQSLVRSIEHKHQQIDLTQHRKAKAEDQLADCQDQLEAARDSVTSCQARVAAARAAVTDAERRLKAARAALKLQQERFSRRIAAGYVDGPVSYADVLLGARDFNDFLDRQYYVEKIAHRDGEVLGSLRAAQQRVASERAALLKRQQALVALQGELAAHERQVALKTNQQQQILSQIKNDLSEEEKELDQLEQDSRNVAAQIRRAIAERSRRQRMHPGRYQELPPWTGFRMPVAGRITSGFGMRMHPILHRTFFHSGIDIAAALGTPIHAAAAGEVMSASLNGGYGMCIIILHGNGVETLYGHCSRIAVHAGQRVSRGEVIGNVGSTGRSTGPHLHFEVRRNGVAVNPL